MTLIGEETKNKKTKKLRSERFLNLVRLQTWCDSGFDDYNLFTTGLIQYFAKSLKVKRIKIKEEVKFM